ncbi:YpjP family protein [Pontibacillus marinus]|uniref:YpjP-like protein n=1 Tax=Pontibacillus marinus BH030004 = DSM 16465 TaxID=1385511 RepID=A0A0A5FYY9_9BACI|nr:YpjP family protein [Pontibacillus marinus]KGX84048.1 hypothetical protein N783_19435 [Pontibacillus marinus BH030004 = DSM 16465]
MKPWFRKIFVVFVAILTLGLYIPPTHLDAEAADKNEIVSPERNEDSDSRTETPPDPIDITIEEEAQKDEESLSAEFYISTITEQAKEQTVSKLGPRIIEKVEVDFEKDILPSIEDVVQSILAEASDDEVPYYSISEEPSAGYGEQIFSMYDERSNQEIARFHVRRDKRPGEGYWFNFHYHLSQDGFEEHHPIGEIYWDKNTPPKWMS